MAMKRISVDGRELDLYWFTGKVLTTTKNLETQVHGGGGGGYVSQGSGYSAPVTISSTTTVHDQIFLAKSDGTEMAFQLHGFNVACRESNLVTVLWAIRPGEESGSYVLVYNHTTKDARFDDDAIKRVVRPSVLACASIVLAAIILSIWTESLLFFVGIAAPVWWYARKTGKRFHEFKASISLEELASTSS